MNAVVKSFLSREKIAEQLRAQWPWASEEQIAVCAEARHAQNEEQKTLRPITIHEIADRWYSYEKVVDALASGCLRPNRSGTFDWLHVLAVDASIARMRAIPHPNLCGPCHDQIAAEERQAGYHRKHLDDRARALMQSFVAPMAEPGPGQTHIYFIKAGGVPHCKIGKADNISNRFRDLQNMSGVPLQLLAYRIGPPTEERDLHRKFKDERLHGEWFEISDRVRRFISKTRREFGLPQWAIDA